MTRKEFLRIVGDSLRTRCRVEGDARLLAALSGGADSVALLLALQTLGYDVAAAHCNFRLRGEESDRDEQFVRDLCARRKVPLYVTRFDTRAHAAAQGISIEMAARELRYDYFEQLRRTNDLDYIAVAHHRDDNAETLLLNLLRGSGLHGLTGIKPRNGHVVRPLLDVSRADVEAFLKDSKETYVIDSSNLVDDVLRNKLRLHILPQLRALNPSIDRTLHDTAGRLGEAAELYDAAVEDVRRRVMTGDVIDLPVLEREKAPRTVLYELLAPYGFSGRQVEEIFLHREGAAGKCYESAGWRLLRDRGRLVLKRKGEEEADEESSADLADFLKIEFVPRTPAFKIPKEPHVACLDAAKCTEPLSVRRIRKGDRFTPYGMKGSKLVSDYLTDRKRTRFEKEEQWVVCCGDKIAWLVGERPDARFCITETTQMVIRIEVEK